jgi:hypothetical protein
MGWLLPLMWTAGVARAAPHRHALVVGSNRPGPEQSALRYAQEDARRMEAVLTELGGFDPQDVEVLRDPDSHSVTDALTRLSDRVRASASRDEDTFVVFYYSGHARAAALELGSDVLPLDELRRQLEAIPATVRLVVLDACQTGAFSQVKGVEPAADFSWHSANDLDAEGLAVLASSTSTELSQESPEIAGSYFTHHLVSGLRGAADGDGDGAVTLSEAYAYAHDRTLVSTARTAVGEQHVTLETALKGRGDLVLTRPVEATARLELRPTLDGQLLLSRGDAVVLEATKSRNANLRLALPAGDYVGIWREDGEVYECPIDLGENEVTTFDTDTCAEVEVAETETKGAAATREHWMVEGSLGVLQARQDAYTDTLVDFGFDGPDNDMRGTLTLGVLYAWHRSFAIVMDAGFLDMGRWTRDRLGDAEGTLVGTDSFRYTVTRLGFYGRARLPFLDDHLVAYAQAGAGPTLTLTTWTDVDAEVSEPFLGYHLAGALGGQLMLTRNFGGFGQAEATYAPAARNLLDQTHDGGGVAVTMGLRFGY